MEKCGRPFINSFWLEDLRAFVQILSYKPDRTSYEEFADMLYDTAGSARVATSIRSAPSKNSTQVSPNSPTDTYPPRRAPEFFVRSLVPTPAPATVRLGKISLSTVIAADESVMKNGLDGEDHEGLVL